MIRNLFAALVTTARGDRGATAVEYGLMAALVVVALVGVVFLVGGNLDDLLNRTR